MSKDTTDKKDTLIELLKENNQEKLQDFLLRNGKKKSYSPIYIKKETIMNNNI